MKGTEGGLPEASSFSSSEAGPTGPWGKQTPLSTEGPTEGGRRAGGSGSGVTPWEIHGEVGAGLGGEDQGTAGSRENGSQAVAPSGTLLWPSGHVEERALLWAPQWYCPLLRPVGARRPEACQPGVLSGDSSQPYESPSTTDPPLGESTENLSCGRDPGARRSLELA